MSGSGWSGREIGWFGIVVGDAFGDGGWRDIERSCDSGSAGHIGNRRFASEEAGDGEVLVAETEVGFGALAVKFGTFDTQVGIGGGTIGNSFALAAEVGEVEVVGVIAVEDDDVGVHVEENGFSGEVGINVGVGKAGGDKIG